MRGIKTITPYSGVRYVAADYPALKFFLPFAETGGAVYTDAAGGLICTATPYGSHSTPTVASLHSVPNAITCDGSGLVAGDSQYVGVTLTPNAPLPAPNGKIAVLITVWGPTPYGDAGSGNFGYSRFGYPEDVGDFNMFVISQNSKDDAFNNTFKSQNGYPSIGFRWIPLIGQAQIMCTVVEYVSASEVRNDYWIDGAKTNGSSISNVYPFTKFGTHIQLEARGQIKESIYTMQLWHFDTLPTDMLAFLMWTKASALSGNKTPYPGWRHRT